MSDENKMPKTKRSPVVKALSTGRDGTERSNILGTPDEEKTLFSKQGAVEPPLDPVSLAHMYELSTALRSNIDSYVTNIDSFGHRFEPVLDLNSEAGKEKVKLAMMQEKLLGIDGTKSDDYSEEDLERIYKQLINKKDNADDPGEMPEPAPAAVESRIKSLKREMIRERLVAERFFAYCTVDESFEKLRMKTRQDVESTGNGYWEVLRNQEGAGDITSFMHVASSSMRLLPQELTPIKVKMPIQETCITSSYEFVQKRFRKFVQGRGRKSGGTGGQLVWFKEFGDPRLYSARTGKQYKDKKELKRKEEHEQCATEIIHFKVHSSRSPYGIPRWACATPAVVGTRKAEEVNLDYFENKCIPPLAFLVSNGTLKDDDVTKLENVIKNEIRGKKNFHKCLILQAEPSTYQTPGLNTGQTKIDMKPLTDAQHSDAQFLQYIERNIDMIGSAFRLPRLLRGDARDFNRATAQSSLEFTEQQVFSPLRNDFDYYMNRVIMPLLGVNHWRFVSRGPDFSDPEALLKALNESSEAGYLTPAEQRSIAERGFGVDLPENKEDWTQRPLQLTLASISTAQRDADGTPGSQPAVGGEGKKKPEDNSTRGDAKKPKPTAGQDNSLAKRIADLVDLKKQLAKRSFAELKDDLSDSQDM